MNESSQCQPQFQQGVGGQFNTAGGRSQVASGQTNTHRQTVQAHNQYKTRASNIHIHFALFESNTKYPGLGSYPSRYMLAVLGLIVCTSDADRLTVIAIIGIVTTTNSASLRRGSEAECLDRGSCHQNQRSQRAPRLRQAPSFPRRLLILKNQTKFSS
jgi:hypothetical protein